MFFVDDNYHNRGIGRKILSIYEEEILKEEKNEFEITVNSSLYAAGIYEKFGFKKTGDPDEKDGIISIPMKKVVEERKI